MSYRLSDMLRRCRIGDRTARDVLRCLCDYADDTATCYPSRERIMEETEIGKNSIAPAIAFLEREGWIFVKKHQKFNLNVYTINVEKLEESSTKSVTTSVMKVVPDLGESSTKSVTEIYQEYIKNISRINQSNSCSDIESSPKTVTTQKSQSTREKQLPKPDDISEEVWSDFLKLRKAKKAPFTATALKRMQKQADIAGLSLQEVFEICCSKGWIGFEASWLDKPKINRHFPKRIEPDFSDPNYYLEE